MKKALRILLIASSFFLHSISGHSQKAVIKPVSISGTYEIRKFVSYNQVQQKDYKGTGSWEKFPCEYCRVTIIKKDSVKNIGKVFRITRDKLWSRDTSLVKLGAYVTYTNTKGVFRCLLKDFRSGQQAYVVYGNSDTYKRLIRLNITTSAGVYTQK